MPKKYNIDDMRQAALKKGGVCLSDDYINLETKLKWRCSYGHVWDTKPSMIIHYDTWCPKCSKSEASGITMEHIERIATKYEGYCLSERFIDIKRTKMEWMCKFGHVWKDTIFSVRSGKWCPTCKESEDTKAAEDTMSELRKIALQKGGRCLSRHYLGERIKLEWECDKGHVWETEPRSIKKGAWCLVCLGRKKGISDMKDLAVKKGGECLSPEYQGSEVKLEWKCSKGHTWFAKPAGVIQGKWCLLCSGKAKKTIEDMQTLAAEKGGRCLSEEYKGNRQRLLWECAKGHTWEQRQDLISAGHWCPECSGRKRKTIEDMQALAKQFNGSCVSKEYMGSKAKHQWQCDKGHVWEQRPDMIKSGKWCSQCKKESKVKKEENTNQELVLA